MINAHSARISRSQLSGQIAAPPSKSHTLRAILFASLAKGTSIIHRYLASPDTDAMITACQQLGARITTSSECITVTGVSGKPHSPTDTINVGNSGIVLRFIMAVTALLPTQTTITGDHSVRTRRPVKPLMNALNSLGGTCYSLKGNHYAPLEIKGPIKAGDTCVFDGSDSQTVSGLMIAASLLPGHTNLHITNPGEIPWVGLTCHWLNKLGVPWVKHSDTHLTVSGISHWNAFDYTVPGDFSSIAFPVVAAVITQSSVTITHLDFDDPQGDQKLIDALIEMGATITRSETQLSVSPSKQLKGISIDVNDMIDAIPALSVAACFCEGKTQLTNAAIAREKECDRIHAMTTELTKCGAMVADTPDSLTIEATSLHGSNLKSYHDHRTGMALSILALALDQTSLIQHITCINKTYRHFYDDLITLGANLELIA